MPEPIVESVEALPSEESGNVPAEAPNPEPAPADPAPTDPKEPAAPAATEPELFELPDGRKVDAETLAKEWKENFMPDYTRKSQELAKVAKPAEALPTDNKPTPKVYENPEWQPQSYAELIAIAKEEVKGDFAAEERARAEHAAAVENQVVTQLNEIKTADPTLNENALFNHAIKYGFRDLKLAHQNMKDMSEVIKKTQTTTAANIAKRNDPVSISPGATGAKPNPSNFGNAVEFLRSLK